jgi:hypothetical protein
MKSDVVGLGCIFKAVVMYSFISSVHTLISLNQLLPKLFFPFQSLFLYASTAASSITHNIASGCIQLNKPELIVGGIGRKAFTLTKLLQS